MELIPDNIWLSGPAIYCPHGTRLNTCPFTDIENRPFPGKIELLEKLEIHEKNKLLEQHEDCLKKRRTNGN